MKELEIEAKDFYDAFATYFDEFRKYQNFMLSDSVEKFFETAKSFPKLSKDLEKDGFLMLMRGLAETMIKSQDKDAVRNGIALKGIIENILPYLSKIRKNLLEIEKYLQKIKKVKVCFFDLKNSNINETVH